MRILLTLFMLLVPCPVWTQPSAIFSKESRFSPVRARHAMVASQEAVASRIGLEILEHGGNAVDASVAVAFALAVTLPRAGNLGGGGFMLLHIDGETVAVDYRETAPKRVHKGLFLDESGEVNLELSQSHGLAVGTPGTVAGMALVHQRWGTLPWNQLLEPAIQLAEKGIVVTSAFAESMVPFRDRLYRWPSTREIFFKTDGSFYQEGEVIRQCDLAKTLRQIAERGAPAFYSGSIAKKIVEEVQRQGGGLSLDDLIEYRPVLRKPLWGSYQAYTVAAMPPPSSGGVHIIQLLNILEGDSLREMEHNSAAFIHLLVEALKRAYADRSLHLGDSDFVPVPVKGLIDKRYARQLRREIDLNQAKPSSELLPGNPVEYESLQTTHFSVVDRWGNAVSSTYTLNASYGSGLVAEGTGILLNNEMDDFSLKEGVPNAYGLVGGDANAVEAGKRPLSSMSPTIIFKEKKPYLVTGSPGGSQIITTVLQVILNLIVFDMNIAEATNAPRVHHQWQPDTLYFEKGISFDTRSLLKKKGHRLTAAPVMGGTQSICIGADGLTGASDPRKPESLTVGY